MKKVILISGKLQSGKNQFAEYLQKAFEKKVITVKGNEYIEQDYRPYKISSDLFARSLKDWCKEDFAKLSAVLENLSEQIKSKINLYSDTREHMIAPDALDDIENTVDQLKIRDDNWYEDKTEITRVILQLYGTDIFRKRVDDNFWVQQMKDRVLASNSDIILITDTRFPNEIEGMYDDSYETVAIRIQRNINTQERIASHASETSLDNWTEWDYVVENNGSLEHLEESAELVANSITGNHKYENPVGLFTRRSKENIQWEHLKTM